MPSSLIPHLKDGGLRLPVQFLSDIDRSDRAVGNGDENKEENDPNDSDASNLIVIAPLDAVESWQTLRDLEESATPNHANAEAAIALTRLSLKESPSYWSDFKSCALKMMLKLMANPSLQAARVSGS